MKIVELDEDSLQEIITYLDFESLKNVGATCRILRDLCRRAHKQCSMDKSLKRQLVNYLRALHPTASNIFYGDNVLVVLQFMLQTLDCCLNDSLEINKAMVSSNEEMERSKTLQKLLSNVCKDVDCNGVCMQHINHVYMLSLINIDYWYSFRISTHEFVYLCNTKERSEQIHDNILHTESYAISVHYNDKLKKAKVFSNGLHMNEYGDDWTDCWYLRYF